MRYNLDECTFRNAVPELGDILKNVVPIKIEETNRQEVFVYRTKIFRDSKGIIFPNDDIVRLNQKYNVIITNLRPKLETGFLMLSAIYHELSVGNILQVKISERSRRRNQPMFRLYGFFGFVNYGRAEIGEEINVEIMNIKERENFSFLETRLYR